MRIYLNQQQCLDLLHHMMSSGMRQLISGNYPVMNRLVDPNDEATTLDCDTNTVYCVRVKACSSELDKIDMLMNIWGNFLSLDYFGCFNQIF